jgi:DUF917 family protein
VRTAYFNSIDVLRSSKKVECVLSTQMFWAERKVALVAYVGAPSVSNERLLGSDELYSASLSL